MSDRILCGRDGAITRITLNRPDVGNKMTDEMAVELTELISGADDSQIILLRGAGDDFCLGRDTMGPRAGPPPEALALRAGNETIFNCYGAFRGAKNPVVGVVQGQALGFGCALAALCDITLASEDARFQLPEMGHNIMPTMAMSSLIDRLPLKAIMYLTYSTAKIDAARALAFGLVSQYVPADRLEAELDDLLSAMTGSPPAATRAVKEFAHSAVKMDIEGANKFASNLHATINSSSAMRR